VNNKMGVLYFTAFHSSIVLPVRPSLFSTHQRVKLCTSTFCHVWLSVTITEDEFQEHSAYNRCTVRRWISSSYDQGQRSMGGDISELIWEDSYSNIHTFIHTEPWWRVVPQRGETPVEAKCTASRESRGNYHIQNVSKRVLQLRRLI
jgi:hypothetical protein